MVGSSTVLVALVSSRGQTVYPRIVIDISMKFANCMSAYDYHRVNHSEVPLGNVVTNLSTPGHLRPHAAARQPPVAAPQPLHDRAAEGTPLYFLRILKSHIFSFAQECTVLAPSFMQ